MSDLGQWLFEQQKAKILAAVDKRLSRTGVVQTVTANAVTVTDPMTGTAESQLLPVVGAMPIAGERVIIFPLSDGSRVAMRLGVASGGSAGMPINGRNFADNASFDFVPSKLILDTSSFWVNQVNSTEMYLDLRYGTGAGQPAEGDHIHDDRYYTDAEVNALLAGKADTGHSHGAGAGYEPQSHSAGRVITLRTLYTLGTMTGITLTANRCYYMPIYIPTTPTLDALMFEITTNVSGNTRLGLYEMGATGLPGNRLVQTALTAHSSIGVKAYALTHGMGAPGWYMVALASTTAIAVRGSTTAANLPALRGGEDANLSTVYVGAFETLTAGWSNLPASGSGSSLSNTYLHLGARIA